MPTPTPPGAVMVVPGTPVRPTPDFTITSAAQFTNANVNNTAYRVIAVNPGVVAPGTITLSASGTASAPRWLMLNRSDGAHPANLTTGETAAAPILQLAGNYWIVDRMCIRNATTFSTWSGSNNRFQFGVFDTRIGTGNGQKLRLDGSNNTVVNCVFRNPLRTPGQDSYAIYIQFGVSGSRIIGNEFIGMPNGVQIPPGTNGGNIISSNEFYHDSTSFADCSGNLSPTGNCVCGEGFPFVSKGSGATESYFEDNFIWNYSNADDSCSGSGAGGMTMVGLGSGNQQSDRFTIRRNTIVGRITNSKPTYGIYAGLNVAANTISENYIANTNLAMSMTYIKNSTLTNNVYSNNTTNYGTSAQSTGNTVSPAGAGRAAVAGERSVVKYHLTNPTPVSYP